MKIQVLNLKNSTTNNIFKKLQQSKQLIEACNNNTPQNLKDILHKTIKNIHDNKISIKDGYYLIDSNVNKLQKFQFECVCNK